MKQIEDLKLAYRRTFNNEDGVRVIKDLKTRFGYETTKFTRRFAG